MGTRFRKSMKICKGVRVNFGKTGASLNVGTKGCRYTMHTSGKRTASVGIAGTGLYYTQSMSNAKSPKRISEQQLQRQNPYSGKQNQLQQNASMVTEYENYLNLIQNFHKNCEPTIDWQGIAFAPPPFQHETKGPKQLAAERNYSNFKPNLLERLTHQSNSKRKQELRDAIAVATEEDNSAYNNWEFMHQLAKNILAKNTDSYLTAVNRVNPFKDLEAYGSDFEFYTDDPSYMTVEFKAQGNEVTPAISMSLTKTGRVSKKALTKTQYFECLQNYVCSYTIRVARDIFSIIPVDTVIVHVVNQIVNKATGRDEDCTILSVVFERGVFNEIDFDRIDPSAFIELNKHNMKFMKTTGFKPVERLSKVIV